MQKKYLIYKINGDTEVQHQNSEIELLERLRQQPQIYELILRNVPLHMSSALKCQIEIHNLIYLGLNQCNLVSLKYLPHIQTLKRLTLDGNLLRNNQMEQLEYYNNTLQSLSVMKNHLVLNDRCLFQKMTTLIQLSLKYNTVQDEYQLRIRYFDLMPNLQYIDGMHRNQKEIKVNFTNQKEELSYLGVYLPISSNNSGPDNLQQQQQIIQQPQDSKKKEKKKPIKQGEMNDQKGQQLESKIKQKKKANQLDLEEAALLDNTKHNLLTKVQPKNLENKLINKDNHIDEIIFNVQIQQQSKNQDQYNQAIQEKSHNIKQINQTDNTNFQAERFTNQPKYEDLGNRKQIKLDRFFTPTKSKKE